MEGVIYQEVLRRAGEERRLIKLIRKRQAEFLGHIMKKEQLEKIITTVKIEGKWNLGSRRTSIPPQRIKKTLSSLTSGLRRKKSLCLRGQLL